MDSTDPSLGNRDIAALETLNTGTLTKGKRKGAVQYNVALTKRDLEIIEFILDMKFASAIEVFQKYFKQTRNQESAKSIAWAKKRLMQLDRGGYLKAIYSFYDSTRYFVVTRKGYQVLVGLFPEKEFSRYSTGFDLRTFIHDRVVLKTRLEFEEKLGAIDWISDRRLRAGSGEAFGFTNSFVPDGVCRLPSGELVAIEIEIARKSTPKYRDKVRRYVNIMRDRASDPTMIKKVYFHCYQECVSEALKDVTAMFSDLMEVRDMGSSTGPSGVRQ